MTAVASTTVDLARIQFATTSIFHFLFVPLTLGLGPLVAIMQTRWHRSGDEAWLRLTRFFGTLFLINFAIGVATGLVQEFEFGMNWSVYSRFVGNVFGAPLAIEGLAAFMLEATFLGLWIFGWNRLSPRAPPRDALDRRARHLAVGVLHPRRELVDAASVGYKIVDGEAQLTSVWALLSNGFALRAYLHTMLAGLIFGSIVMLGVCCWHFLRGREVDLFRKAAKLALIVAVPVTLLQLVVGNRFGEAVTSAQSMKIAASEAQWNTCQPCGFSLFQIGGFTEQRRDAELLDHDPTSPVVHGHRLVRRPGAGPQSAPGPGAEQVRPRQLHAERTGDLLVDAGDGVRGVLMFLIAAVGAWLYWKRKLEQARWFHWTAIVAIASRTSPRPPAGSSPRWDASRGSCRACCSRARRTRRTSARPGSDQPRLLHRPLRRAWRRRLRPDAPLRAASTRRLPARGDELAPRR